MQFNKVFSRLDAAAFSHRSRSMLATVTRRCGLTIWIKFLKIQTADRSTSFDHSSSGLDWAVFAVFASADFWLGGSAAGIPPSQ